MTTLTMPTLHRGQRAIAASTARFRVLACGRRWGKTRLGALLCVRTALERGRAWWVAPSYKMAAVGWRLIRQLAQQIPGAEIRQGDQLATMPGGGSVQVRSADDPQALRGEGLDFVVLDECAFIAEATWTEALRPALSDRHGGALFISTPKGRNWFWRLWQSGSQAGDGEWQAWCFATSDNPYIDAGEIAAARQTLPERVFRQEYLAEFIDDAGGVFRRVVEAATAQPQTRANINHVYVAGLDWALHNDFTVAAVIDATTRTMVSMDRYNGVDYSLQRRRVASLYERFGVTSLVAEENAMGGPNNEALQAAGLNVRRFTTTNAAKATIIENLAAAFERGEITILADPLLVAELQAFEMSRLPSGQVRYSAPEGMHDDCVMALALAWSAARNDPATAQRLGALFEWQ